MNHLNMICRRRHGSWSVGWKYQTATEGNYRAGLYVNNYFGEELLITFNDRRNLVLIFSIGSDIHLSAPQEINNYEQLKDWLRSEVPCYNDPDFDEGCWMMSALNNMGWMQI